MRLLVVVCLVAAWSASSRAAEKYELADLQALEKQQSWEELVEHLGDLPPSKRDATWMKIAEHGCAALLAADPIDEKNAEGHIYLADRIIQRYPVLKQSKAYMEKRAEVGLKAFGFTYSQYRHSAGDDKWLDQIKQFVKDDPTTPDLPQRAAKRVQNYLIARVAWPLWKSALERKASLCGDADFRKSLVDALVDGVWQQETAPEAKRCFKAIKADLLAAVAKTDHEGEITNVCTVLKANGSNHAKCL
jgi:hypothetical protein